MPTNDSARTTRNRRLRTLARVLMTLVLIGVLAYGIDWEQLATHLAGASWSAVLLAFVGLTLQFGISAWKWQCSLRIHQLNYKFGYLLKTLGIGFFFNHFLPSGIGGDAYRVMKTLPRDGFASRAVSAVVVERLVGFAVLMVLGALGAIRLADGNEHARRYLIVCAVVGICVLIFGWALRRSWLSSLTDRVRHTKAFIAIEHNIDHLRNGGRTWLPLIAASVLFQTLAVAIIYGLLAGLDAPANAAQSAVMAAISGLATVIPIAINGLGVVEGSFAGAGAALNVGYESALVAAILIRLLVVPHALVFGVLYAMQGNSKLSSGVDASAQMTS